MSQEPGRTQSVLAISSRIEKEKGAMEKRDRRKRCYAPDYVRLKMPEAQLKGWNENRRLLRSAMSVGKGRRLRLSLGKSR
jgi:hypothetical protein